MRHWRNFLPRTEKQEKKQEEKKFLERCQECLQINLNISPGLKDEYQKLLKILSLDYCECLKSMSYERFLTTDYWRIIKRIIFELNGGKCFCGSCDRLNVHHASYKIHGYEHDPNNFNKLDLLCEECHQKRHNK